MNQIMLYSFYHTSWSQCYNNKLVYSYYVCKMPYINHFKLLLVNFARQTLFLMKTCVEWL